jgi:hypothetical protein
MIYAYDFHVLFLSRFPTKVLMEEQKGRMEGKLMKIEEGGKIT